MPHPEALLRVPRPCRELGSHRMVVTCHGEGRRAEAATPWSRCGAYGGAAWKGLHPVPQSCCLQTLSCVPWLLHPTHTGAQPGALGRTGC